MSARRRGLPVLLDDRSCARIRVRAVPGARREGVIGARGDAWRVAVRAAPERGRANEALVRVLAAALGMPVRSVRIIAGQGTRDKTVEVVGLRQDVAVERLGAMVSASSGASSRGGARR